MDDLCFELVLNWYRTGTELVAYRAGIEHIFEGGTGPEVTLCGSRDANIPN